jgi:cell division protein FtsI (penicillin-binding protein 3)
VTGRPPRQGEGRPRASVTSRSSRPPAGPHSRPGRPRAAHRAPRRGLSAKSRKRAFFLLVTMGVAFIAIILKLTYLQAIGGGQYVAVGASEWTRSVTLPAERGAILDRNGDELAVSIPQQTVYADPKLVTDPVNEAAKLAPVLGISQDTLAKEMAEHNQFTYLDRRIPDATANAVKALKLPGIYFLTEPKRFYPGGQLARPLLGLTGSDDESGLSGLEYKYQSLLDGKPGKEVDVTDPAGNAIPGGQRQYQAPVAGADLVTTLDEPLQFDAEQALAQAIVQDKAKSGMALLMDRRTGDILADAQLSMPGPGTSTTPAVPETITSANSTPTTGSTPTQPVEAASATSFTQVYEPGSVNKLVTISGALQAGDVVPSDTFTIPDAYPVAGTLIHDAENHGTQHWNVTDILANSSNIGTLQIAQRLGRPGLLSFIHGFGEGQSTDIGFPGESAGLLPSYWSGTTLADVSFGQGIGVTAMQELAAYNTIANGGVYVAPRLVAGTVGSDGRETPSPASPTHRVVSPTVAAQMTTMLDEVVRVGTGQSANLTPYTVAGKTGTANIAKNGQYLSGDYTASFAGFAPSEDPSITAMVVISGTPDYGATASAPTFATLMRDALQELEVPPHPKTPPAPGVPLTNSQTATAAGESVGTPLDGVSVAPAGSAPAPGATTSTTAPGSATTAPGTTSTTAPAAGAPGASTAVATTSTTSPGTSSSPTAPASTDATPSTTTRPGG